MGSTGNVYTVTIKKDPSCTCPDYVTRYRKCKHIYFILIKVMKTGIEEEDKESYSETDLIKMFKNIPKITEAVMVNSITKDLWKMMKEGENPAGPVLIEQKSIDDLCPICLDDLNDGSSEIDYCKYSCGKSIHVLCFNMWKKKNNNECVYCRRSWEKKAKGDDNYVNLIK